MLVKQETFAGENFHELVEKDFCVVNFHQLLAAATMHTVKTKLLF